MSIKLDSVLTIAIGRNGRDGEPMSDERWQQFQWSVLDLVDRADGTVVCHALSVAAIGSDGVNDGEAEDSAVFVVVNVQRLDALRRELGDLLGTYGQSSACFSFDLAHEPVFAGTTDGYRPRIYTDDITADLERQLDAGLQRRIAGARQ